MTPQEKDLITQLLTRLATAGGQAKDPEAEALIRQGVARQPDAPYYLVQTVLVQEMALAEAQNRIQELERQLAAARPAPAQPPTSFLRNALRGSVPSVGTWGCAAPPATQPGPVWTQSTTGQPAAALSPPMMGQPMPWGAGGGGFLRQAASTAAGIAGGALLFQGIQSLFGPHYGNLLSSVPMQPGLSETVINNYYGADDQGGPDLQQADAASDPGGGQDYAADRDLSTGQDFGSDQDFGGDGGVDV